MRVSLGAITLVYPTPVFVVGSYDEAGRPNIMNAAWGGICSSKPPSVAVSIRPERHTHRGILKHHAFTISIPSAKYAREADYVGLHSGRDVDKFAMTGLTPVRSDLVAAPYVKEFPLVLECRLLNTLELGAHTQFVGEILDVKIAEGMLGDDHAPDIRKIDPILFSPSDRFYYRVGESVGKAFEMGKDALVPET
ncbi:MAG: flavin reductase family protein [Candidatus Sumerlaeota bacterium]|nr:flavin reductase family protein [Candidatus Sumerlaeota bacterium]